jgi:hypothetical protein
MAFKRKLEFRLMQAMFRLIAMAEVFMLAVLKMKKNVILQFLMLCAMFAHFFKQVN